MPKINICFSSDNNYAQHLAVTLVSVLENKSPDDEIFVYVLDGGITDENKTKILNLKNKYDFNIKFLTIDQNLHKKFPQGKKNHITPAAYYRLLLPELCPDLDKLLYLDVDIIVKTSLAELFETDISDKYYAGVIDCDESIHLKRLGLKHYCNSGVLVLNLKKWREDNITEKFFRFMREYPDKIVLHDQDVINCVLRDGMLRLAKCWNVQVSLYEGSKEFVQMLPDARIIHYIGKHKPWHANFKQVAKEEYFKYLRLTEWKDYEKGYRLKLYANLPLFLIGKFLRFLFALERQNGKKVLTIIGLKFRFN